MLFSVYSAMTNSSNSAYALSKSSFTIILSCTPSCLAYSNSFSAVANLFNTASTESVFRERSRRASSSILGGLMNKNRAFNDVFFTFITPYTLRRCSFYLLACMGIGVGGYLHFNIEDTFLTRFRHSFDSCYRSPVIIIRNYPSIPFHQPSPSLQTSYNYRGCVH